MTSPTSAYSPAHNFHAHSSHSSAPSVFDDNSTASSAMLFSGISAHTSAVRNDQGYAQPDAAASYYPQYSSWPQMHKDHSHYDWELAAHGYDYSMSQARMNPADTRGADYEPQMHHSLSATHGRSDLYGLTMSTPSLAPQSASYTGSYYTSSTLDSGNGVPHSSRLSSSPFSPDSYARSSASPSSGCDPREVSGILPLVSHNERSAAGRQLSPYATSSPGTNSNRSFYDDDDDADDPDYDDSDPDYLGGPIRKRRSAPSRQRYAPYDYSCDIVRPRRGSEDTISTTESLEIVRPRPPGAMPTPVPVPNLTKKSRGRRVPTTVEQDVKFTGEKSTARTHTCVVPGCGKCFARGEHLKRHVRSIHTHEKREPAPDSRFHI